MIPQRNSKWRENQQSALDSIKFRSQKGNKVKSNFRCQLHCSRPRQLMLTDHQPPSRSSILAILVLPPPKRDRIRHILVSYSIVETVNNSWCRTHKLSSGPILSSGLETPSCSRSSSSPNHHHSPLHLDQSMQDCLTISICFQWGGGGVVVQNIFKIFSKYFQNIF